MPHRNQLTRFAALDGLRGLFALSVVLHHSHLGTHLAGVRLIEAAYLAVDFFFVLSGFVISHGPAAKLVDARSGIIFTVRRFARVWPLHVVMLAAFVGLETVKWLVAMRSPAEMSVPPFGSESTSLAAIPAHLTLTHALHIFSGLTWNEPSWSISAEFYTYVSFALLAITVRPRLSWAAGLVAMGSALFLVTAAGTIKVTADYGIARCLYGFFLGHLAFRLYDACQPPPWLARAEWWTVLLVLGFAAVAAESNWSLGAPLVFAGAVLVFAYERGSAARLLRSGPLQWLGERSYAIYMIHMFLYASLDRGIRVLGPKLTPHFSMTEHPLSFGPVWLMDLVLLAIVACTLLLSDWAYRFVEKPCQKWINGWVGEGRSRGQKASDSRPSDTQTADAQDASEPFATATGS